MLARIAADAVVVAHLAFIAFVMFGAWLVLRWTWIAWLHVPAFVWGAAVEFSGAVCPLTPLEQQLRAMAGDEGYTGGFVAHYIVPVIYPAGLTPTIQLWLGVFVVLINVGVYAYVGYRWRRHATGNAGPNF
jgi:Protein of Unknown function (DUF2784)